jgi:hypothetical protein
MEDSSSARSSTTDTEPARPIAGPGACAAFPGGPEIAPSLTYGSKVRGSSFTLVAAGNYDQ